MTIFYDKLLSLRISQISDISFMVTAPSPYDHDKQASLFVSRLASKTSVSDHLRNREGKFHQILVDRGHYCVAYHQIHFYKLTSVNSPYLSPKIIFFEKKDQCLTFF